MSGWVQCVECEGSGMRDTGGVHPWGEPIFVQCYCDTLAAIDNDGETVRAGDLIAFSFGTPGRRVEGRLFARAGELIMPTPDVTPKEATLPMLHKHVGGFWKVSEKTIALREAIYRFGPPDIMNSDQGSQFTSFAWTDRLRRSGIRISMDGKGRYWTTSSSSVGGAR